MFVYEEEEVCTLFDILLEVVFVFMRQKSAISVSEKRLQDRLNQDHPRYGFCGNEFLGHSLPNLKTLSSFGYKYIY